MGGKWTGSISSCALLVCIGCSLADGPADKRRSNVDEWATGDTNTRSAILDGRDPDGTIGFYWLAPIQKALDLFPGTFDPALAPTVEICEWANKSCVRVVARMTIAGTVDGRITVDAALQEYRTIWRVAPAQQDPNKTFRIWLTLDGRSIGFADVVGSAKPDLFNRLVRFRLESSLRTTRNIGPAGGTIAAPDSSVSLVFPTGALAQLTAITLTRTAASTTTNFFGAWDFGPEGTIFSAHVTASFAVDPALLAAAGPGSTPIVVTQASVTDTTWTIVAGSTYDATLGRIIAPLTHFSTYGVIALTANDINCARIIGPQTSGTFPRLNCRPPSTGQYHDTVFVSVGGSVQTAYIADVSRLYGPMWIIGTLPSCENVIVGFPKPYCVPFLTSSSLDPTIAIRGITGRVTGAQLGRTYIAALAWGFFEGASLVLVSQGSTATQLFSFVASANADVGGSRGTLFGGASLGNGRLTLDGASGFAALDRRIVGGGSFSIAFFAREPVRKNDYVEFISQGASGAGFYVGHTPAGNIRVSDTWQDTGIPMPQDNLEHHYTVTVDSVASVIRLYIDGQLVATKNGAIARGTTGGNNTRFGRQFDPFSEYLGGELDNLGVYGKVLSDVDVQTISKRVADLSCSAEGSIGSGAGAATSVVFENQSGEAVRVEWLDFAGKRVLYHPSLPNAAAHVQGTYLTHPWIITGVTTGTCYGIWLPITEGRIVQIK